MNMGLSLLAQLVLSSSIKIKTRSVLFSDIDLLATLILLIMTEVVKQTV